MDKSIEQQRTAASAELTDLSSRGLVQKVLLLPLMFGGEDDPRNITWLPPLCAMEKEQFDENVRELVDHGKDISYEATPAYDGPSMVPALLTLTAEGYGIKLQRVIDVAPYRTWQRQAD